MIYEVYKDLTAPLHIWYHYKRRNCEGGENGKTAFSSRAQTEEQLYKMQIASKMLRTILNVRNDISLETVCRFS